jgi:hypothetical protein
MKKILLAFIVSTGIILQACTPTTSLLKITDEYRTVTPEKSRLLVKYDLPAEDIPIVKVKVSKDYFSQKIYTKHYETLRKDKKGSQVALGLALSGGAAGLIALGSGMESKDSTLKTLSIVGGVIAGLMGLYMIIAETPKELWTKDSVDFEDTLYAFQEVLKSKSVTLQSDHDRKTDYLKTNNEGILFLDIRNFYTNLSENNPLKISFSDGVALPNYINLPSSYVIKIRGNELEAEKMFRQAEAKVKEGKFINANSLFEKVVDKYPLTKHAEDSKTAIKSIESNIKEEKLEIVRKNLRAVSVDKVPEAFDKAGISPSELNEIGYRIERMSRSNITIIMVDGLGMSLDRYQAEDEFNSLNNSQKIYAILTASESLSKKQGKKKWELLSSILGIDESIAKKFARIESGRLVN